MKRIVVIGTTGSGKTTLASQLAAKLQCTHVELDALHWEPGWQPASPDIFEARISDALAGDDWVVDGNYSKARDAIWPRADTLVWLDYPFLIILKQLSVRTARRIISREVLWGSNRESVRMLFSRDSIILWLFTSYGRRRKQYHVLFARPEYVHLNVVRLTSPRAAKAWLDNIPTTSQPYTQDALVSV